MAKDEKGPFAAGAFQTCDDVRPVRVGREDLDGNAVGLEHLSHVIGRRLFHPRRVARVHPHERLEMHERLGFEGREVGLKGRLRR
jgi:hypothetical protein